MKYQKLIKGDSLRIKTLFSISQNLISRRDVFYVVEDAEWAIKHIGEDVTKNLKKVGLKSKITFSYAGIFNSVVHFGSVNVFMPNKNKLNRPHKSNKVVVTYFHVLPDDERIEKLLCASSLVNIWHTPNSITKEKLVYYGFPKEKIVVIPLGIDIDRFKPISVDEKRKVRQDLNIPDGKIVIGSFQKDGLGWDEGLEPKLIKGPDIFCNAVEKIAKIYPVFVLLIGPSRGYIKERLKGADIPFKHYSYIDYSQIHRYYSALDIYLITSRIEGGPRALLECMATSTPFVATKVGMVPDVVTDYNDGLICDAEDEQGIMNKIQLLIEDKKLKEKLCLNMRKTAERYSWDNVIVRYYNEIYNKLKMEMR